MAFGMTNAELAQLIATMGAGAASSAVAGKQNSQNQQLNQSQLAQQQLDQNIQRIMAGLQNQQQTSQNLQMNRQQMPQTQASMSPLGQEQTYVQRQRLMQAMLPEMAKFNVGGPTDPAIKAAYTPPTNMLAGLANQKLQSSYGDQATATALADRRKLMAQINPNYNFSSLGEYGLDSSYDQGVNDSQMMAGASLKAYEAAQASLANQQTTLAQQQLAQQQAQQTAKPKEKKGGGILGKIGGVLKVAAPIAALAIPGVGPLAAAAIAGGGTAAGNLMQGGSVGGSLLKGGLVGAGGAMAKSSIQGNGLNPFNNTAGKVVSSVAQGPNIGDILGGQVEQGQSNPMLGLMENWNSGSPMASPFPQGQQVYSQPAGPAFPGSGGSRAPNRGTVAPKQQQQLTPQQIAQMFAGEGQTSNQTQPMGGQNIGERSLMRDAFTPLTTLPSQAATGLANRMDAPTLPKTPYPFVNQANAMVNGFMAGATQGVGDILTGMTSPVGLATLGLGTGVPAARGMMAAGRAAKGAAAVDSAVQGMNTAGQAARTGRAMQFNNTWNTGVNAPNMNTGLNAKSIMQALSGSQMDQATKQKFLASPEVQAVLKSLLGVK